MDSLYHYGRCLYVWVCLCVCLVVCVCVSGAVLEVTYRDGLRPGELATTLWVNEEVGVRYLIQHDHHSSLALLLV